MGLWDWSKGALVRALRKERARDGSAVKGAPARPGKPDRPRAEPAPRKSLEPAPAPSGEAPSPPATNPPAGKWWEKNPRTSHRPWNSGPCYLPVEAAAAYVRTFGPVDCASGSATWGHKAQESWEGVRGGRGDGPAAKGTQFDWSPQTTMGGALSVLKPGQWPILILDPAPSGERWSFEEMAKGAFDKDFDVMGRRARMNLEELGFDPADLVVRVFHESNPGHNYYSWDANRTQAWVGGMSRFCDRFTKGLGTTDQAKIFLSLARKPSPVPIEKLWSRKAFVGLDISAHANQKVRDRADFEKWLDGGVDPGYGLRSHLVPFCVAEGCAAAVLEHSPRDEPDRMPGDCACVWEGMDEFFGWAAKQGVLAFECVFNRSSFSKGGHKVWDAGVERHLRLRGRRA